MLIFLILFVYQSSVNNNNKTLVIWGSNDKEPITVPVINYDMLKYQFFYLLLKENSKHINADHVPLFKPITSFFKLHNTHIP